MTIHKLSPERAQPEGQPFSVGVSFQHDLYDVGEAVFKTRAIQAFENAATRYAIHRRFRCAVRRELAEVFDDLALNTGLAPQRMNTESLLLDGPGVFAQVTGERKAEYTSCTFNLWTETKQSSHEVRERLLSAVGERLLAEQMFVIDWQFSNSRGTLVSVSFEEMAEEVLHDEAYPSLGMPVCDFVQRYLHAQETVLVLQGPPGTGKTRLVRYILGAMSRRKRDSAEVMYTADKRALEKDEIFVEFITGTHDAFVIEDADHMMQARSSGNQDLHRFLGIADGVVRAQGRKIIFTTNLPNIGDLDEALLRPGRCFGVVKGRSLNSDEIERLVIRLCAGNVDSCKQAMDRLLAAGSRTASVANVYRACNDVTGEALAR